MAKAAQKAPTKSIAVLPFANMAADEENDYIADGLTEEIINALAKIPQLKVTSRTSSFYFKNKNIPISQIGETLNVTTILEGSIRIAGGKMRITAQLIDVSDDYHFWSETFDRSIADIFAVQDEISLLIADKLREHVGHFELTDHLVESPSISVEDYTRYLQSRYHILRMTKGDLEKGMAILEGIIAKNPSFALAYLGMNLSYSMLASLGFSPAPIAFAEGQKYLAKAIEIEPNLPECQLQLAYNCLLQDWDFAGTYRHVNKAMEIRPIVETYQTMASTLVAEYRYEAALNYIDTAIQIDPFSTINYHLKGFIYYVQEQYDIATSIFEKSLSIDKSSSPSNIFLGQALILMSRPEEALAHFNQLPADESGDLIKLGGTTMAQAALGNREKANQGIEMLEQSLASDMMGRSINFLMFTYVLLGQDDKAIDLIQQGVEKRLPLLIYLPVEPMLKPLRGRADFRNHMDVILAKRSKESPSKRKYKKSLLEPKIIEQYKQQLEQLMQLQKPYLDPSLSIRSLAQQLDIPANHLSQLLNEGFDKNFSEYVNSYRLETFKSMAANPANRQLTILALAFDSGFNSKTVFNTFFKKMTGSTPSAYWKTLS